MGTEINPFDAFTSSGSTDIQASREQFAVNVANNATTPLFTSLSTISKQRAVHLAADLPIHQYDQILAFGLPAQEALKKFTAQMLNYIQRKDVSRVGEVLSDLMRHLAEIDPDALVEVEKGFFARIFSRPKQSIQEIMTHYNKLSKRIDRLSIQLSHTQNGLLADYQFLNELYAVNEEYFQEVNVFIASLEIKKQHLQEVILPTIQQALFESTDPFKQNELNDLHMQIEWLDRRMYDLEISREVAIQYAPQIRLIQQTNQLLIEKIQSSIMNMIPLWQSQIAMLLSMNNQRRAMQSQQRLMDASEELLRKNGKMLETTSKSSKRPTVNHEDIDRFKQTQLRLLQDIEDTLRVQVTSNEKRHEIEHIIIDQK
ncbi:toxic anion resistance protein [Solibacillus cecembensis]|uniref:toxic anion resistance protein n=1 Tax=Solibacillus cecembensis TaxID=459347 RepID=UPI003AA385D1